MQKKWTRINTNLKEHLQQCVYKLFKLKLHIDKQTNLFMLSTLNPLIYQDFDWIACMRSLKVSDPWNVLVPLECQLLTNNRWGLAFFYLRLVKIWISVLDMWLCNSYKKNQIALKWKSIPIVLLLSFFGVL